MGGQPLYRLTAGVSQQGTLSDSAPASTFGIRTVSTYLTPPSDMARDGVRVFAVNGRPVVIRGGGFTEGLFLHYSAPDRANLDAGNRSGGPNPLGNEADELPVAFGAAI